MGFYDSSSDSSSDYGYSPDWYYAVAVGRCTGIYTDVQDALDQVHGYSGFKMRKFAEYYEAREYLHSFGVSCSSSTDDTEEDETWYYAVAVGRSTGIYTNYEEAQEQVHRFPSFRMKKFLDYEEAQEYIEDNQVYYSDEDSEEEDSEEEDPDWYYAVAVGRCTGIFTNWDDAMEHTTGFSHATFRKFPTFELAETFLAQFNLDVGCCFEYPDGSRIWFAYDADGGSDEDFPDPKHPDTLVAFCDGSALGNGQRDCDAAYACVFPHNRDWDAVKAVKGPWATNNRAEYLAALAAMRRANREDPYENEVLYIYTDSTVLINSMTKWIYKWRHNGWETVNGTQVKNRDILQPLLSAQGDRRVLWRYVRGHTDGRDWESHWNDVADRLAREEARRISGYY